MTHRPPRLGDRPRRGALATVLAAATILLGMATAAQAHDVLVGTSPGDGSIVAVAPAQVTVTFQEPALAIGTTIIVTGPTGQTQAGKPVLVDNTVTQRLRPAAPSGRYTVLWRVTSDDGHPVSGRFSFTARSPSPGQPVTAPATHPASTEAVTQAATQAATQAGPERPPAATTGGPAAPVWWVMASGLAIILLLAAFAGSRRRRT